MHIGKATQWVEREQYLVSNVVNDDDRNIVRNIVGCGI
jgi:hypothetical protein